MVKYPFYPVDDVFYLREGEDSSWQSQPDKLHGRQTLTAVRIPLLRKSTTFHSSDTAAEIESTDQRSCRIFFLWNMIYKLNGIKMGAETAEANINAGLAAATQICKFFATGDRTFQLNK